MLLNHQSQLNSNQSTRLGVAEATNILTDKLRVIEDQAAAWFKSTKPWQAVVM